MITLGRHLLVEYFDCDREKLTEASKVENLMIQAASVSGATVIESNFHPFAPQGISGVVIVKESHLTIHTWPELNYAAVDIFTCGDTADPWKAFEYLKVKLGANDSSVMEVKRGPRSESHLNV